jgi:hypothetical protein
MRALCLHALAPLRNIKLIGLHLFLNAVLIAGGAYWLLIPDAHIWQLVFSTIAAMVMVSTFLWLHSATLVYGAQPAEKLRDAFRFNLTRLIWMLLGLLVILWIMSRISGWMTMQWQIGGYLYSKAPEWLRPVHGSAAYVHTVRNFFAVLNWYLLPGLILPLVTARITDKTSALRTISSWRYWTAIALGVVVGVWVSNLLLSWTPGVTLRQQSIGLILRLGVVYLLGTAAWLWTTGVLGYFASSESSR